MAITLIRLVSSLRLCALAPLRSIFTAWLRLRIDLNSPHGVAEVAGGVFSTHNRWAVTPQPDREFGTTGFQLAQLTGLDGHTDSGDVF